MGTIGTIAAIIGAVVGIATLWVTIRNTKGSILKRIKRKKRQVHDIEYGLNQRYGINGRFPKVITPWDEKRTKLLKEIEELQERL